MVLFATSLFLLKELPLQFEDHVFLTATYLINKMPTAVLHMESPYSVLYKQLPDYEFLKVFGCTCTCYPHIRPYNPHKFAYHSRELRIEICSCKEGMIPKLKLQLFLNKNSEASLNHMSVFACTQLSHSDDVCVDGQESL
ncbi:retrovirus-related Pol polyprotein from transposon TNT 1-94 [Trifolium pratense]|uniref:Retrovirus-related Pol polyprotein from transposon TNT 1-94 n=1 Tax=Trifolium pratense TaxID=57577 RepID=A0A2K3LH76_TRIPR|nr:retrovirus-related Pol polyprotein from transposon TNT 1-94 [Trifolium pratense]